MSTECKPGKIKNKTTNKCITIGGKTFNDLLKDNKNDKFFNPSELKKALETLKDVEKLTVKPTKPVVKPTKPVVKPTKPIVKPTKPVVKTKFKFDEKTKERKNEKRRNWKQNKGESNTN